VDYEKTHGVWIMKRQRNRVKGYFFLSFFSLMNTHSVFYEKTREGEKLFILSFFSLMKRSKNHPTTELAKNLMYSLNLPIQPQPVEDF
jgi:hypothetical protein